MGSFSMVEAAGSYQFKINHSKTKNRIFGKCITSPKFRVGEHVWAILYYPQGCEEDKRGKCVSVFLELQKESTDVAANFGFALLEKPENCSSSQKKHGVISSTSLKEFSHKFTSRESSWGSPSFITKTNLEQKYVKDGYFVLHVAITLKDESCPRLRASSGFPHQRLQNFRKQKRRTDVSFDVSGTKFVAHRLILEVHSPKFEELFGQTPESSNPLLIINDTEPSVFKTMLNFIYDGSLLINDKTDDGKEPMSSISFLQKLLVAADHYVVHKLKSICEQELIESISLDTVLTLLEFGVEQSCGELKKECLEFIAAEDNFRLVVLTEGYIKLMQKYRSLLAELKE
jgi:speckle-type POZ protein